VLLFLGGTDALADLEDGCVALQDTDLGGWEPTPKPDGSGFWGIGEPQPYPGARCASRSTPSPCEGRRVSD